MEDVSVLRLRFRECLTILFQRELNQSVGRYESVPLGSGRVLMTHMLTPDLQRSVNLDGRNSNHQPNRDCTMRRDAPVLCGRPESIGEHLPHLVNRRKRDWEDIVCAVDSRSRKAPRRLY